MSFTDLPTINAALNGLSSLFLILGYSGIKNGFQDKHKRYMILALVFSTLFLISYLIYHNQVGSVPYPHHDWTRVVYFTILIPHIILAAFMVPFIIMAVVHAARNRFEKHKKITRWLWWVWIYVSISGIIIYFMLYIL